MTFNEFNNLPANEIRPLLEKCCGSENWLNLCLSGFPFETEDNMLRFFEDAWYNKCNGQDWIEAFSHHPKIGDLESLKQKFSSTKDLAENEQRSVSLASESDLKEFAEANKSYESKHGFIYIVSAEGKSVTELLGLLKMRLKNRRDDELNIAMGEQYKITLKRLDKIVTDLNLKQGQVTTHVLDTGEGKPGEGIFIALHHIGDGKDEIIAVGVTNKDGRISELLPMNRNLNNGNYKMVFDTAQYFSFKNKPCFYPSVEISFTIPDQAHYHIPLLISSFGFTTYRGS